MLISYQIYKFWGFPDLLALLYEFRIYKRAHLVSDFRKKISPRLGLEPTKMISFLQGIIFERISYSEFPRFWIAKIFIFLWPKIKLNLNEGRKSKENGNEALANDCDFLNVGWKCFAVEKALLKENNILRKRNRILPRFWIVKLDLNQMMKRWRCSC